MKRTVIIISSLILAIVALGYVTFGRSLFDRTDTSQSTNNHSKLSSRTNSVAPDGQSAEPAQQSPSTTTTGSVSTPSYNDAYPVANEHYQINQVAEHQFDITLYAISNSPAQYDEYQAQLKQYKQEALAYLTSRYGDISSFIISWTPPTAKNL